MTRFFIGSSSLMVFFMLASTTAASSSSVASMSSSSIEKFEDTLFSATMKEGFEFDEMDIEIMSPKEDFEEDEENGVTLDGTAFLQRLRGLNENNNQNQNNQNNQQQQQNNQNNQNKYYNYNNNNNAANVNYNNKQYNYANGNANQNADWLHDYQLKFQSCHELSQYNSRTGSFDKQMMIKFKVCPRDTCDRRILFRKCRGGATYAADARDFIGAYLESKLTTEQRTCKYQQSICQYKCRQQNGNGNGYYYDDNCTQNCMANGNYNYCLNGYGYNQNGANGQNNKNNPLFMENYMECTQLQKVKNSSTGYPYYGKAHCGLGGHGIYFSLYTDQYCTIRADSTLSMYDFRQQYGVSLPFVEKSMVSRDDCVSCRENYNNNGHANYYDHKDQNDVAHSCSALYQRSLKCENQRFFRRLTNFGRSTYSTEGCQFINRSLPAMDDVNRGSRRSVFMNVLAWILGLAVCYLCVISCMMGKKSAKAKRLAEQDYHNSEENFSHKEKERQREWEKQQRALERDNHHLDDNRSVNTSSTRGRSKSPFKYFKKGSKHSSDDHSTSRHSGVFS